MGAEKPMAPIGHGGRAPDGTAKNVIPIHSTRTDSEERPGLTSSGTTPSQTPSSFQTPMTAIEPEPTSPGEAPPLTRSRAPPIGSRASELEAVASQAGITTGTDVDLATEPDNTLAKELATGTLAGRRPDYAAGKGQDFGTGTSAHAGEGRPMTHFMHSSNGGPTCERRGGHARGIDADVGRREGSALDDGVVVRRDGGHCSDCE
jgi:hypothetical protein